MKIIKESEIDDFQPEDTVAIYGYSRNLLYHYREPGSDRKAMDEFLRRRISLMVEYLYFCRYRKFVIHCADGFPMLCASVLCRAELVARNGLRLFVVTPSADYFYLKKYQKLFDSRGVELTAITCDDPDSPAAAMSDRYVALALAEFATASFCFYDGTRRTSTLERIFMRCALQCHDIYNLCPSPQTEYYTHYTYEYIAEEMRGRYLKL